MVDPVEIRIAMVAAVPVAAGGWVVCRMIIYQAALELIQTFAQEVRLILT
jgi:hypothetical protein